VRTKQNAVALAAIMLAAGTLLPLAASARFVLAGLAFVIILLLLVVRLRSHAAERDRARVDSVYDRIDRIRAQRGKPRR
jgi:membrane protein implicated in regulation of membrane protease activity